MIRHDHYELPGCAPETDRSDLLHVVIVHDDRAAYESALRLLARTLDEGIGFGSASVQPFSWRVGELAQRSWRERAWADAGRADVFLVATTPGASLPEDMIDWLEMSFERRRNRATAVIWLDDGSRTAAAESSHRSRLRRSAEAAGLDFLERSVEPMMAAR